MELQISWEIDRAAEKETSRSAFAKPAAAPASATAKTI